MKKKSKHQICRELAAASVHTQSELSIQYDKLRQYMDEEKTQEIINEATIISYRCHVDLPTIINQIIGMVKIFDKKKYSKIMKTKKFKEQKQNLIEHLLDICHVKTEGRKIIIALLEEIKVIDRKLDKKKRKQPLFLLEHGLADIGDFKPISVKTKECLDYYDKLMSVLRPTFDVDQKVIDKLNAQEDEYYLRYADGTTSKIGYPKRYKRSNPYIKKTKECIDYYDDWLKQMRDSIIKVNKCKNELEKVIKKWLPIGIINSDIPDLKIDEHKNRVCSELAEKSAFHINDFKDEYDKIKSHFPENKLKDRLQSIAEFAASSGLGMSHVSNFLIENKSTS